MFGIKKAAAVAAQQARSAQVSAARTRLYQYLTQVQPWAAGKFYRGWFASDFTDKKVKAERLNPAAVIFPVPALTISVEDSLLFTENQWRLVLNFQHSVSNFNAMLEGLNRTPLKDKEIRYKQLIALHVGCIGSSGTGGLHDAFYVLRTSL
jgi:hypothetical protein